MIELDYQPPTGPTQTLYIQGSIAHILDVLGNPNGHLFVHARLSPTGEPHSVKLQGSRIRRLLGYRVPSPVAVTAVDLVLFAQVGDSLYTLLIRRDVESSAYPGYWALPGGHVDHDETCKQAAYRETLEETGIALSPADMLTLVDVFDDPGRDPRGPVRSIAYTATVVRKELPPKLAAGTDAAEAEWVLASEVLRRQLAFDHARIFAAAQALTTT